MRSGFGHTAVVGGVAAVGLVLAVLSFAGGSSDNTDQDNSQVILAAANGAVPPMGSHPSAFATTTTSIGRAAAVPNEDTFCSLASDYVDAYRAAHGFGMQPSDDRQDWQKQLEFLSVGASLVSPEAVDPQSGNTWRSILLAASDRQAVMNLGLAEVGWDLGKYRAATPSSSSGVAEAPSRLIQETCAIDIAG